MTNKTKSTNKDCSKKQKKSNSYKDDLSSTISSIMSAIDRIYDDKKGKKLKTSHKRDKSKHGKKGKESKCTKKDKESKCAKKDKKPRKECGDFPCDKSSKSRKSSKSEKKHRKCKIHYITASPCPINAPVLRTKKINIPCLAVDIDKLCATGSNFLCQVAASNLSVSNKMYVSLPSKPKDCIKVLNLYLTDLNVVTNRQVKKFGELPYGSCVPSECDCNGVDSSAYISVDCHRSFPLPVDSAAVFTREHDKKCKKSHSHGVWLMTSVTIGEQNISFCN